MAKWKHAAAGHKETSSWVYNGTYVVIAYKELTVTFGATEDSLLKKLMIQDFGNHEGIYQMCGCSKQQWIYLLKGSGMPTRDF